VKKTVVSIFDACLPEKKNQQFETLHVRGGMGMNRHQRRDMEGNRGATVCKQGENTQTKHTGKKTRQSI
jgi:hypothetical protein